MNEGQENLDKLKKTIATEFSEFHCIFFVGDLLNDVNDLEDDNFKRVFINALKKFSENKKVFITFGNHDKLTRKNRNDRMRGSADAWTKGEEKLLIDALTELENVIIIKNKEIQRLGKIKIGAFSPNADYYLTKKESKQEYETQFYENYDAKKFDKYTYNILLTHEPQSIIKLSKEKGCCIQENTDLVISGHMHNGLLPVFVHKIIKNTGLISPQMEFFPTYAQGEYTIDSTDFIINGAINTRVETPIINNIYGPSATILTINPSKEQQKIKRIK